MSEIGHFNAGSANLIFGVTTATATTIRIQYPGRPQPITAPTLSTPQLPDYHLFVVQVPDGKPTTI